MTNIKVEVHGVGVDTTPALAGSVDSPFFIAYSPIDKRATVNLGSNLTIDVISKQNATELRWKALGAYIPRQAIRLQGNKAEEGTKAENSDEFKGNAQLWRLEKDAFRFGFEVYNLCEAKVAERESRISEWGNGGSNGESSVKIMEAQTSEVEGVNTEVQALLDQTFYQGGRLGDKDGSYAWIGLDTNDRASLGTKLTMKRVVKGTTDLIFSGSPYLSTGSEGINAIFTPNSDNCATVAICGMMHGFEAQSLWNERTACIASLFQHAYRNCYNWEALVTSAARVCLSPRLGSELAGVKAFVKLLSLANSLQFLVKRYTKTIPDPVGDVSFYVAGVGGSEIIKEALADALSVTYLINEHGSAGGITFMPAHNIKADMKMAIVRVSDPDGTRGIMIEPFTGKRFIREVGAPITVSSDSILQSSQEYQTRWVAYPMVLSPTQTLRLMEIPVGMGIVLRDIIIRDRYEAGNYLPSDLIKAMMLGWPMNGSPQGLLSSEAEGCGRLADIAVDFVEGPFGRESIKDGKVFIPKQKVTTTAKETK